MLDGLLRQNENNVAVLEMLGKKASDLHIDKNVPMTDAVFEQVNGRNGMTDDHIRRVTEFANNKAFTRMFKTAASDAHKLISFDGGPADPAKVIELLRGNPEEVVMKTASDKFIRGMESYMVFHDDEQLTKIASASTPRIDTAREMREYSRLRNATDRAEQEMDIRRHRYESAVDDLCKEAQTLLRQGTGPTDIAVVLHDVSPSPVFTKLALKHLSERLSDDPMVYSDQMKIAANYQINPEHPLINSFESMIKTAMDFYEMAGAHERLRGILKKADVLIKEII